MFDAQSASQDQIQAWIAQNPQLAQAVTKAMTSPQPRYTPVTQPTSNWGTGRNAFMSNQPNVQSSMPMLHGRVIATPQDIRPNEIPMDGSASLFPMNDDSCIYAKAWNPDGKIDTIVYVRENTPVTTPGPSPEMSEIMNRLEKIEKMLTQQNQRRQNNYNNRNQRTEVITNAQSASYDGTGSSPERHE